MRDNCQGVSESDLFFARLVLLWVVMMKAICWLLLILFWAVSCSPTTRELDQTGEKNPYYITGRQKLTARDYRGAVADFEKTLEIERTLHDPIALAKPYTLRVTLRLNPTYDLNDNMDGRQYDCTQFMIRKPAFGEGEGGLLGIAEHP